jgi:hypothetical protein
MFRQTAETVLPKKIIEKDFFLTRRLSIEIVPEILLPPCIWDGLSLKTISRYCPFKGAQV